MANVTVLHGRKPDASLVALLRDLLADAESGRLTALVGIADYHDREPDYLTAGVADWWAMRGRLADLGTDITQDDSDE